MIRHDPTKIFFESDVIRVTAKKGDFVAIKVKRGKQSFETTIDKSQFSRYDQDHFNNINVGSRLRRGSSHFTRYS